MRSGSLLRAAARAWIRFISKYGVIVLAKDFRRSKDIGARFLSGDITNANLDMARLTNIAIGEMPADAECCWVVLATTSCTTSIRETGEACCWIVVATTGCSTIGAADETGEEDEDETGDETGDETDEE